MTNNNELIAQLQNSAVQPDNDGQMAGLIDDAASALKALQAEVERLGFNEMAHLVKIQDMDIAIAQLRAKLFDAEAWVADTEIADTEKDAMRYRKFRNANADQRNRLEHYAGPALDIAIDAASGALPQPVQQDFRDHRGEIVDVLCDAEFGAVVLQQFRKQHCSDWYDGVPDNTDGGGPYETRTLFLGQPSQARDAARYQWLRSTTNWASNSNNERIDVRNSPEVWDYAIDAAINATGAV